MNEETINNILRHFSNKEFCNYFYIEMTRSSNNLTENQSLNDVLKAINEDVYNYIYNSDYDKLSDNTVNFIKQNFANITKVINIYEAEKRKKAIDTMSLLKSKVGTEVYVQYWKDGQHQNAKLILRDVKEFDVILLGDGTTAIPFIGKNIAIFKITTTADNQDIYCNPNVKDVYECDKDEIINIAKEDIFGIGYDKTKKTSQQKDQTKQNDKENEDEKKPEVIHCPYCGNAASPEANFCPECGKKFVLYEVFALEYFDEKIKELNEKIKECQERINANEIDTEKDFIELATYQALKQLLLDNIENFKFEVSENISKDTKKREDNYSASKKNLDDLNSEISAESIERKKKRLESRKETLSEKIGEIRDKQRTVINERLSKAYDKMLKRAKELGKTNGKGLYYDDQVDVVNDQIAQINDDLSEGILNAAIKKVRLHFLKKRIKSLQKKQGKINTKKDEYKKADDIVSFKI